MATVGQAGQVGAQTVPLGESLAVPGSMMRAEGGSATKQIWGNEPNMSFGISEGLGRQGSGTGSHKDSDK